MKMSETVSQYKLSASMMTSKELKEAKSATVEHTKTQKYIPYKLGRRVDPFHKGWPAVQNGQIFGSCTANVYDFEKGMEEAHKHGQFVPEIGKAVWIQGRGFRDYVRTSLIQDYYIHDEPELSKDKIVLPAEHAEMLEGITWNKGDVLLVTMNSLYYLKNAGVED